MKINKNSETATTGEGHLSKSELERTVPTTNNPDTKRRFSVVVRLAYISEFPVYIDASSREEAAIRAEINTAKEHANGGGSDFQSYEVSHLSVDPVDGGQDND